MTILPARYWLLALLLVTTAARAGEHLHHHIQAHLEPAGHTLRVEDRVTLADGLPDTLRFRLHAGLEPRISAGQAELERLSGPDARGGVPLETYRVTLPAGARSFTLSYGGTIHHPVTDLGQEYARSFSVSPGIIDPGGVFLGGSSRWLPSFEGAPFLTFELAVTLPEGWRSVSQGERSRRVASADRVAETWRETHPQEEVYLIAAPFTEYRRPGARADAVVYLRRPDEALANRYLELTGRYLEMYARLIGDYPYAKFALVENFWETGYGMPSFTLLGPRVVRLPFIPYTSYPHEILHNWWGNGVYVDYAAGNWSEGLTSYLADHLLKEQRGDGAGYRRGALQKYADYAHENRDFALTEFRGRHNSVTEAVGYGKTLMVFHMLRQHLGDRAFTAGLRRLYADHAFRVADWGHVANAFSTAAGEDLAPFFEQWVTRAGAPELRLGQVTAHDSGDGHRLEAVLWQTQDGPAYTLDVPLAVQMEGREEALVHTVRMADTTHAVDIPLPARPLRVAVDPAFDLFRRLHREEIPPAISQALGSQRVLMVLPAAAPAPLREAYRGLVESWQRGRPGRLEVRSDAELDALPQDRAVWLLGWDNRFRPSLAEALTDYDFDAEPGRVTIAGRTLSREEHAAVVLARHPGNPEQALAWVAADHVAAMPGLARKLPHYGKYSYLGFSGDGPENVLKGQWPVIDSPLTVTLAARGAAALALPERPPLAELPPAYSAARMLEDVRRLADPALEGRGLGSPGLEAAAAYIAGAFDAMGLEPGGDPGGGYLQGWRARTGNPPREMTLHNVVGVLPGADPALAERPVVVGAHYDHLGQGWPDVRAGNAGRVHPGADDNASGVAVMLELARALAEGPAPQRPVHFVAFTGEEAERLGSRHYLEAGPGRPFAMVNLDTVGRLEDGPLYVLGAESAREWVHIFRGAGYVTGAPVETVTEPLDASDQTTFIAAGVPAVQLFSGAHGDYHRPSDTADKVDGAGLVTVASVAREAIDYLAGADARMTPVPGQVAETTGPRAGQAGPRQAGLGSVPDFAYGGEGVRLSGVNDGSPAQQAGLAKGDVVVAVNGRAIADLRQYADALRTLAPGDAVTVRFLRDGQTHTVETTAAAR